jgi:regulation of enolase protein 1 (concanavalin A-like superfamily)
MLEHRVVPAMKGLAGYPFEMPEIQPSWTYNWGNSPPAGLPANVEFVPMVWGYGGNSNNSFVGYLNWLKSRPGVQEILGFNEPDMSSQSNLTVAQALDGWQYMSQLGIPVISPAAANDTDSWMQQFMAGAAQRGYRIDAVAIHWYGGGNPSGFIGYVDYVHNLYNKPVWITEFGLADWSGNGAYTPAQAYDFMSQVIPQLDARPYVQRYCWFPTTTTDKYVGMSALFNTDWSLTAVGQLYAGLDVARHGWTTTQVGTPGIPGSASFAPSSGAWTVSGSGVDIWNTSDQFTFVAESFAGDGSITADVTSLQNTDPWAKAGVMYRGSVLADDIFADVVATPGNGVAFQWRATAGAIPNTVNVTGLTTPIWTRLVRSGNNFSAYYSSDGTTWTQLGTTQTIAMGQVAAVGLAVTSHNVNASTTATFTHVSVLPPNWTANDIGAPGLPGSSVFDSTAGTWTVAGTGADIWGTSDQFQFAAQPFAGDGSITARVTGVQNTDPWAKAGVMFRDSEDANAAFADVVATPGNGVSFQWRASAGGTPFNVNVTGLSTPVWTRLVRSGNNFSAFYSTDFVTWTQLGTTQTIAMSSTTLAGLAVTSHNVNALATATFSYVSVLPASWNADDVGAPGLPGSTVFDPTTGTWTVAGDGTDIWSAADHFQFAAQPLTGDGSITAQVTSVQYTDPWAKAGVMFRNSDDAGAAFADVVATPGNGVSFQWRPSAGGTPNLVTVTGLSAPIWVKLTRAGSNFTAFYSSDGNTWTQLGSAQSITMNAIAQAGLAVTAHDSGPVNGLLYSLLNTSTFANVAVTPAPATSFTLTAPTNSTAGTAVPLTLTAYNASGNVASGYTGTVHFTSSDPMAALPKDYTFTAADLGTHTFTATLFQGGTATITATDTLNSNITPGTAGITVQTTVTQFAVTTTANPAVTGMAFNVTATAENQYNDVVTNYNGLVTLSSSDPGASFAPNGFQFTSGDQGVHTFSATLNTPGSQTITVQGAFNSAVSGTTNAIATRGLEVSNVSVTPYGFTLTFNKAFNPSVLNLYDGGTNSLGPADLTLSGATNGVITNGTLVVTSPTTLSYVYTFGVLPDDSYTLVLRSASNGFVDNAGVPLDGANSGNVAGTNYTTTFSRGLNAPDVGLAVPSFARGPGQSVSLVVPGSSPSIYYPGIPIQLSDGNNATTASFTLTYNTALLNIANATVDSSNLYPSAPTGSTFTRTSHTVVSGIATDVFAFSTNGNGNLATGNGPVTIGELTASIPNTTNQQIYKAKQVLTVSGATGNGTLPVVGASGVQVVAYLADASGDGAYAGNDASLVGRVAGGQDTGFAALPLVDPVILADVAGEGTVTANDASQVAQLGVHLNVPNIMPVPTGAQVAPSTAPDPLLSIPSGIRVAANGTVSVPVNLDEAHPAGSTGLTEATLALRFDPSVFSVSANDIQLGSIPQAGSGWTLTSAVDARTGQIGITLWSLTPISSNLAGNLVTINFHAQPGAAAGTSSIQLAASVNPNGQGAYVTNVADSNGALILGVALTNLSNLLLNGTVDVLASPLSVVTVVTTSTPVAIVEPKVKGAVTPTVPEVLESSGQQGSASVSTSADSGEVHAAQVASHPAAAVSNLIFQAAQAAGVVLQIGLPTVAVTSAGPALTGQQLADRLLPAVARGATELGDVAPVAGATREEVWTGLGALAAESQDILSGDRWWDSVTLSSDVATALARQGLRQAASQAGSTPQAQLEGAAWNAYFTRIACDEDAGLWEE